MLKNSDVKTVEEVIKIIEVTRANDNLIYKKLDDIGMNSRDDEHEIKYQSEEIYERASSYFYNLHKNVSTITLIKKLNNLLYLKNYNKLIYIITQQERWLRLTTDEVGRLTLLPINIIIDEFYKLNR